MENFKQDLSEIGKHLGLSLQPLHVNRTERKETHLPNDAYWAMSPDQLRRLPALPATGQMYNRELEGVVRKRFSADFRVIAYR